MKKVLSLVVAFVLVFTLTACTDLEPVNLDIDDIQTTITDLQSSITDLQTDLDAAETDLADAQAELDGMPEFSIDLTGFTVSETDVTEDISLPTLAGADVIWSSSDSTVLTADGHVMRPSATRGDVDVTLTAVILDGNLAETRSFDLTVLAEEMTDLEKVDAALQAIDIPDELTEDVTLPTEVGGATLIWDSSNPTYVDEFGTINRPHYDFSDEMAVLTAYVSSGKELKIYKQTVTVEKMDYAVHGSLGNPFTVELSAAEGHTIYVPVENIDREYTANEEFPYIYTPEWGATVPSSINGWGYAVVVNADGSVIAYYDGLNGKKVEADGTETSLNAAHFAKDPSNCTDTEDLATCEGLAIPDDGYVFVFQNTGASNKNNRQFGYTYFRDLEDITINNLTTTPSTMQFEVMGGVWWRGNATVSIPIDFINPDVSTFDYDSVLLLNDQDMQIGGSPVVFTNSYNTTAGVAMNNGPIDINNGWGIAAQMTPETEEIQTIGEEGSEIEWTLVNSWQITRVYDGIGGGLKERIAPYVGETTALAGGDYGKNILLPEEGFVFVFPGTSQGYGSDGDVLNRRIGADYFYHLENWVYDPVLVNAEGLQDVVKGDWS